MRGSSTTRDRWLGGAVALAVLVALVVVGCQHGPAQGGPAGPATATPAAPAAATATPPALGGIAPSAAMARVCQGSGGTPLSIGDVRVGTYDSWQALPGSLPLKPQPISVAKPYANIALQAITVAIPIVPPASGVRGAICAVSARISAYAPPGTPIPNVTRACSDHPYLDPGGADYGGDCGPGPGPAASANLDFGSSAPGTTVSAPITNTAAAGKPAEFPPAGNQSSEVWVVLQMPASGTYTVVMGLWQTLAAEPSLRLVVNEQFDLAAAHEWSGQACTLPAMQATLPPPGNPPVALLCPGAPPPA